MNTVTSCESDSGLMVFLSSRSLHAVALVLAVVALPLILLRPETPPGMFAKIAAEAPGVAAKFGAGSTDVHETLNSSDYGFPDCDPFPYDGCPWPVQRQADGGIVLPASCTRCSPRSDASVPKKIRVACVGDSITAGVDASSASTTYPAQLQQMLGSNYVVTNLGSSGATMQEVSARPFVKTAMYRGLIENDWDIIIIMLGTNDARTQQCDPLSYNNIPCGLGLMSANWLKDSHSRYTTDTETLLHAALKVASRREGPPRVFVATPPPIVVDFVSGCSRDVINHVEPDILSELSSQLLGRKPIDMITPFGGADVTCETRPFQAGSDGQTSLCTLWHGCSHKPSFAWQNLATIPSIADFVSSHGNLWCDFLHPSDAGYSVIAQAVHDAITSDLS